jgi:N-acetylglucosamine malate deacetylase 1
MKEQEDVNPPIEDPEVDSNSRVLVLSPHHDEAIIRCGGTIAKLARGGAHIKVVFMTDTCYENEVGLSCKLVPIDWKEVEDSLAAIRCYEFEHLNMPCLGMCCDIESLRMLYRVIDYYSPDIILLPCAEDLHPDNKMTGLLAAHALKEYESSLTLYSYMLWGGPYPNTLVEIAETMDDKIKAARAKRSWALQVDLETKLLEMNIFSHIPTGKARICESFLRQELGDFVTYRGRLRTYILDKR